MWWHSCSFKIISESAIAAGIRRIEAITAKNAEEFFNSQISIVNELKKKLKGPKDLIKEVKNLIDQNIELHKEITKLKKDKAIIIKNELQSKVQKIRGINLISEKVNLDPATIKDLAFNLKNEIESLFLVIGTEIDGKASLSILISDNLIKEKGLHAGNIIKVLSKEINGGGGGQAHFATAGGNKPQGIEKALTKVKDFIQ